MENRDELFDTLLKKTREMLNAAEQEDIDALGRVIDERQDCLNRLAALKREKMTADQKSKYNEIVILDKKASSTVRNLLEEFKDEIKGSHVKFDGLIRYNSNKYDLSSGRVIDQKR